MIDVTYEVWERHADGTEKRRHPGERGLEKRVAEMVAASHNKEEAKVAKTEMRKIQREYFVMQAVTSFEEVNPCIGA